MATGGGFLTACGDIALPGTQHCQRHAPPYELEADIRRLRFELFTALWGDDWRGLEMGVAYLLQREGCGLVQRAGSSGDGGVDVAAFTPGALLVAVQCKAYKSPVKPNAIQAFHYATTNGWESTLPYRRWRHPRPQLRTMATTGGFGPAARGVAGNEGIHLVDLDALANWEHYGMRLPAVLGLEDW
ncbi:restriction endonuclease [Streptomyces inhibens]|uniref:restriction endonuclease n=1 Tax=Streptomyces inhibens TaxID=2293571 RepID=UPI001EE73FE1|nr:restriction endonuclease [Streptomyces inhibens]UKY54751.1 restriction endonuclease [Streptomyces inhibens]